MSTSAALDRDALYYPYIHVRDVNWLKATLLCFPNVRRIVPRRYSLVEEPEFRDFCETEGPRGPLLSSADLDSESVTAAQRDLLRKLREHEELLQKYSRLPTMAQYGAEADQFQIHRDKMIYQLTSYLEESDLAWHTRSAYWGDDLMCHQTTPTTDPHDWLTLHPFLGSAIMATLAIAVAQDCGLDIVTDSVQAHYAVASNDKNHVFEALLGNVLPVPPSNRDEVVDNLAEVVIRTTFDVSRFSAKQIAALLKDGRDLRQFKSALTSIAETIPPMSNQRERQERLEHATELVLAEWRRHKRSLPKVAIETILNATEMKFPDLGAMALTGAVTEVQLGAAAGLSVVLLTYAGLKVWRKYKERAQSPYKYLTRIEQAVTSVTLPPLPTLLPS
jgi:hypothetical protein